MDDQMIKFEIDQIKINEDKKKEKLAIIKANVR